MRLSNLALCYEAVQRVYRNAVVAHVRSRLCQTFPETFTECIRKPFPAEQWQQIEENAYAPRVSGQLAVPIRDDFDLLGVNHFFNLFNSYFDILFPEPANSDKVRKRSDRKRVLEWARTVKELRDPASHPVEEDFGYEDSFVLMDCARRILLQLGLAEQAKNIKELMNSLSGHLHVIGEPLESSLPPSDSIVSDFVGREKELSSLWEWLTDPTTRRWALAGAGGKGKTAIAYEFALQVRDRAPDPLQVVLWLSAKKRRFAEGQVVTVRTPDFEDLDTALNQILYQYGWIEEITHTVEAKQVRVLSLMTEFPALVVVDDIDSIEHTDEDAIEFFTFSAPQTGSKVLLTSRRTVFGMAKTTTPVDGFSDSDIGRFITSRCRLYNLDRAMFTGPIVKEILAVTEGSPLYIEDLTRLTAVMPPKEAIKAWAEREGHAARQYALGRELDMLSREARQVLIAACMYNTAVSYEELRAVTGLSDGILSDSLAQLQGLFLVPKPKLVEGEARFEINLNVRSLIREVEGRSDMYRSIEAAYRSVSGMLPRVGRGDIGGYIRQAVLLLKNYQEEDAEKLMTRALEVYPSDPDLLGVLGMIYRRMRPIRLTDARQCFSRSHQLNSKSDEMYKHWAKMELDAQEFTKATEAAEHGLGKKSTSKQLHYLAGLARSRLAQDMLSRAQKTSAEGELRRSLDHLDQARRCPASHLDDADLDCAICRASAISAYYLGDRSRLIEIFSRWFREFPQDGYATTEWDRMAYRLGLTKDSLNLDTAAAASK